MKQYLFVIDSTEDNRPIGYYISEPCDGTEQNFNAVVRDLMIKHKAEFISYYDLDGLMGNFTPQDEGQEVWLKDITEDEDEDEEEV